MSANGACWDLTIYGIVIMYSEWVQYIKNPLLRGLHQDWSRKNLEQLAVHGYQSASIFRSFYLTEQAEYRKQIGCHGLLFQILSAPVFINSPYCILGTFMTLIAAMIVFIIWICIHVQYKSCRSRDKLLTTWPPEDSPLSWPGQFLRYGTVLL